MNEIGLALLVCMLIAAAVIIPIRLSISDGRFPKSTRQSSSVALCAIVGHKFKDKPVPVYTGLDRNTHWQDELGNKIAFYVFQCERCHGMRPTPEGRAEADKMDAEIAAVMNGERARFGLRPLNWSRWV